MLGKTPLTKYDDHGNPTVIVQIEKMIIPYTLVDLCAAINIINKETIEFLGLTNLRPTPTMLELTNQSKIRPYGVLEDIGISVDSSEYLVDFLVLQPKTCLGGHPLILGRP
jgi:hypothetical protein